MAPHATLLGVRGRSYEEGSPRWFKRMDEGEFDQADIAFEAGAFAAFMEEANAAYGLSPEHTVFVGYSNGANFLAAFMLLHPGIARRSVLLRPMAVLASPPEADLGGTKALLLVGSRDSFGKFTPQLAKALGTRGAEIEIHVVSADHTLGEQDHAAIATWLSGNL